MTKKFSRKIQVLCGAAFLFGAVILGSLLPATASGAIGPCNNCVDSAALVAGN